MWRIDRRVGSIVQHESVNREILVCEISHDVASVVDAVGLCPVARPDGRGRVVDRREGSAPQNERVRFVTAVDVASSDVTNPVDIIQSCALRSEWTGPPVAGVGVIDRRESTVVPDVRARDVTRYSGALGLARPYTELRRFGRLWYQQVPDAIAIGEMGPLFSYKSLSRIRRPSQHNQPSRLIGVAALRFTRQSPLFGIALVIVRFYHVASRIINANRGIM